ncbi:hypothetical protein SAMN05216582_1133 [Selenomonas ruminantium]|uniref:Sulfatase N-terminal domain-containing protein n=1 Tax=Selenomonas ruminantium TaxID=971 RepID=A0A1M6UKF0_SELRU|nr:sulfatase-like hydrolase/transferase [Selenomonas ruminantium]SHK69623.1 hypothetical protein SAMN05216582_1133 [Selenomonas ruminantium]
MTKLEEYYYYILNKYSFKKNLESGNINRIIRDSLEKFLVDVKKPAIYCNGAHTQKMLSDFVFELKKINIIIDNFIDGMDSGYKIINKDDIKSENIDAIVVSSYNYMEQIVNELNRDHPDIKVLNIYEKLREQGIYLHSNYYYGTHPFHNYHLLNRLQKELEISDDKDKIFFKIINKYLDIKDFKSAIKYSQEAFAFTGKLTYKYMMIDFEEIYNLELECASNISPNNVLMLCMDGLRFRDVNNDLLPKLSKHLADNWMNYSSTYSYSTSTYESLIPAYSENTDMRTKYYDKCFVDGNDCRFIQTALGQERDIFFYTDGAHYIEHNNIHYSEISRTITQKFWDFILDAQNVKNGLFYIHGLYETHFAFPNPYTKGNLIAEGTALLFDMLPVRGGKLRTDYVRQHDDALRYIDDVIAPLLKEIKCSAVFYADHGNLLMSVNSTLTDIKKEYLQCGEEWIRIPFYVKSSYHNNGSCNILHSIMSINDVIISLLENNEYKPLDKAYIKIGRSQIYNPNFQRLYKLLGEEKRLQSFEGFIFPEGYKLIVYADGHIELYDLNDNELFDNNKIKDLMMVVRREITVIEYGKLVV